MADTSTTVNPAQNLAINQGVEIIIGAFWTSKQRQGSSIHEISYRACFKPQLPRYFIQKFTEKGDIVYDPFMGRGTTLIEAALLGRNIIGNDINPLCKLLTLPRLNPPHPRSIAQRLEQIPILEEISSEIDLSMFYHPQTLQEILSLRHYLYQRKLTDSQDNIDSWIGMVATNRLSGHSKGFFSVYTLPPNQAVTPQRQRKINERLKQKPEYRDTKYLIMKKTQGLLRNLTYKESHNLKNAAKNAIFLTEDACNTKHIDDECIDLIVTSPPFIDTVNYATDNWLRCWFNHIDEKKIAKKLAPCKNIHGWINSMQNAFYEFYRIVKDDGWVAFEVGEIKKGRIKLEEYIIPIGINAGFKCKAILINKQRFTKTANIWGIENNKKGTNTNRIVLFKK